MHSGLPALKQGADCHCWVEAAAEADCHQWAAQWCRAPNSCTAAAQVAPGTTTAAVCAAAHLRRHHRLVYVEGLLGWRLSARLAALAARPLFAAATEAM